MLSRQLRYTGVALCLPHRYTAVCIYSPGLQHSPLSLLPDVACSIASDPLPDVSHSSGNNLEIVLSWRSTAHGLYDRPFAVDSGRRRKMEPPGWYWLWHWAELPLGKMHFTSMKTLQVIDSSHAWQGYVLCFLPCLRLEPLTWFPLYHIADGSWSNRGFPPPLQRKMWCACLVYS